MRRANLRVTKRKRGKRGLVEEKEEDGWKRTIPRTRTRKRDGGKLS